MKAFLRGVSILTAITLIVLVLVRKKREVTTLLWPTPVLEWGIQKLYYSNKSSRGFGEELDLELQDGKPVLTITSYNRKLIRINSGVQLGNSGVLEYDRYSETFIVEPEKLQTIESILKEHKARKRAGSYSTDQVLDSNSRMFVVDYGNGESIRASGYHETPEGFWDGINPILALFSEEHNEVKKKVETLLKDYEESYEE